MSTAKKEVMVSAAQAFSDAEKTQGRANIGAGTSSQTLTAGSNVVIADNVISVPLSSYQSTQLSSASTITFSAPAGSISWLELATLAAPSDATKTNFATVSVNVNGASYYSFFVVGIPAAGTRPGNLVDNRTITHRNTTSSSQTITVTMSQDDNYPLTNWYFSGTVIQRLL